MGERGSCCTADFDNGGHGKVADSGVNGLFDVDQLTVRVSSRTAML